MFVVTLRNPGPRPPFYEVVDHVFGRDHEVDTDGNSLERDSTSWTELWVVSRENALLKLDIEPIGERPLALRVSGSTQAIVDRAARFLLEATGGELLR